MLPILRSAYGAVARFSNDEALTEAILALAEMESAEAERLLSSLMENETYTSKPNVLRRLKAANYYKESVDLISERNILNV
tara:strand:- start:231 stop:473 length:243 start_codon:yes stop_codon:yes gene_type:complete